MQAAALLAKTPAPTDKQTIQTFFLRECTAFKALVIGLRRSAKLR
jgi:hypothetical protein